MNDNKINGMSSDSELDAILEEVRRGTLTADSAEEESEPSKTWSLDDIDSMPFRPSWIYPSVAEIDVI